MKQEYIIVIILLIVTVFYFAKTNVIENLEECVQPPEQDLGSTAKDACNRISSKADEIKAQGASTQGIINSCLGWLSPNNLKSGDNTTNSAVTNILNNNLSMCDKTNIENSCKNSSSTTQINEIDCKYCETNPCTIKNVTQSNIAEMSQTCEIQSIIDTLMKKKNNIDTQAVAKVVQEAKGMLSGNNTVNTNNCNIIDTNMSSQSYMSAVNKCSNEMTLDQRNSIKSCGNIMDIIQKNAFEATQSCVSEIGVTKKIDTVNDTKAKSDLDATQKTTGLALDINGMIIILVIIGVLVLGGGVYFFFGRK